MLSLLVLDKMPYIYYPVQFRKDKNKEVILRLIDSGKKVNPMTLAHAARLNLTAPKTNVKAQKIDKLPIGIYGMVFVSFQVEDNQGRARFF